MLLLCFHTAHSFVQIPGPLSCFHAKTTANCFTKIFLHYDSYVCAQVGGCWMACQQLIGHHCCLDAHQLS